VENLDADPNLLRVIGQIAAPSFFRAFPVAYLNHRQIDIQVPIQSRLVFRVTHDHFSPQPLKISLNAIGKFEDQV
jgi:hypothetical protein